jgi:hypothetical protein
VAFLHCEHALGSGWVYAPGRWPTADGCVPVYLVFPYFNALTMGRARDAIDTARGIGLAFGSEEAGDRARDAAFDDAFPPVEEG